MDQKSPTMGDLLETNPAPTWVDVVVGIKSFLVTPVISYVILPGVDVHKILIYFNIFTAVHTKPGILVRGDMLVHRIDIFVKGDGLVGTPRVVCPRPWCT